MYFSKNDVTKFLIVALLICIVVATVVGSAIGWTFFLIGCTKGFSIGAGIIGGIAVVLVILGWLSGLIRYKK